MSSKAGPQVPAVQVSTRGSDGSVPTPVEHWIMNLQAEADCNTFQQIQEKYCET